MENLTPALVHLHRFLVSFTQSSPKLMQVNKLKLSNIVLMIVIA
jgi:hypothetical protein